MEQVLQQKVTKMIKEWEHPSYKGRLRAGEEMP